MRSTPTSTRLARTGRIRWGRMLEKQVRQILADRGYPHQMFDQVRAGLGEEEFAAFMLRYLTRYEEYAEGELIK